MMRQLSPIHLRLASAHLALADDPEPFAGQRSVPRAVGALAAAVTLALATPLAWAAAAPAGKLPADRPVATAAGKAAAGPELAVDDDDSGQ